MEEKRQPMPPQHPAHVLAKMEKSRQQKEKLKRLLPAVALIVLIILIVVTAIPESDDWKTNILRSYKIPRDGGGSYTVDPAEYPALGSGYQRQQISSVTFMDTLSGAPADAWDVSQAGNGSVMAWVEPDGDLYRLMIAGEGGISAGASCRDLFSGYENVAWFSFGGNFHTDAVQDMSGMFYECKSLTSLELGSFDTAAVQDMSSMFAWCESLTSLDLRSFDTAAVLNMRDMFTLCSSLTSLDLSSFDTAAVQNMRDMFTLCSSLTSLVLSEKFTTTNTNTVDMFFSCPAREKYQHLLNN